MSFSLPLANLREIIKPIAIKHSVNLTNKLLTGISTDTREIKPGEAFVALKGDNFDGHHFVEVAVQKGAVALIVASDFSVNSSTEIPQFLVKNTLSAYQEIARWWRQQLSIPIIGVTGSVGKTTTKELIASILATQGKVHKTRGNYNNEIGVPKTLLEIDTSNAFAVIEMAMRARGEIAKLTEIAQPNIGIITNVGTAHIGRLGSEAAIAAAKCELLVEMPRDSIAVLNQDNRRLMKTAQGVWQGKTITFGLEGGDVWGKLVSQETMIVDGEYFPLPLLGKHNALNYLGAIAVAKALSLDLTPLKSGLKVSIPGGRAKTYHLQPNILILDESYNAGLESMLAALDLLKATPGERHLAVLGTMKELGDLAGSFHRRVGERVKKLGIDHLVLLVDEAITEEIAQGAGDTPTAMFKDHQEMTMYLQKIIQPGDRLLFKASRSVKLELVVEAILAGKEKQNGAL